MTVKLGVDNVECDATTRCAVESELPGAAIREGNRLAIGAIGPAISAGPVARGPFVQKTGRSIEASPTQCLFIRRRNINQAAIFQPVASDMAIRCSLGCEDDWCHQKTNAHGGAEAD